MGTIDLAELGAFELLAGHHNSPEDGLCAMEAVAWLEGLPHSDTPECTCPVIAGYVRGINDRMGRDDRQRLIAYLPRLVGTVSPEHEWLRLRYLMSQYILRIAAKRDPSMAALALRWESADVGQLDELYASTFPNGTPMAMVAFPFVHAAWSVASLANARRYVADYFAMLDGVLAIGTPSRGFSRPVAPRVQAYRELVG